jgi:hypothetical protein
MPFNHVDGIDDLAENLMSCQIRAFLVAHQTI